jgi:hypothetical protein
VNAKEAQLEIKKAQVTEATRAEITALMASDPGFKLKSFEKGCLANTIQDPNCEEGLKSRIRIYNDEAIVASLKAKIAANEAKIAANQAETLIAFKILFDLDIVLSLFDTINYVELNIPYPNG